MNFFILAIWMHYVRGQYKCFRLYNNFIVVVNVSLKFQESNLLMPSIL